MSRNLLLVVALAGCVEYQPQGPESEEYNVNYNPEGVEPEMVEDVFLNEAGKPLDIWVAIDRSGSMIDDQLILWNSMDEITNMLDERNVAYHIGVTGAGSQYDDISGVLPVWQNIQYVTPHTPNPGTALRQLLGVSNNNQEAGLDAIGWGLGENLEASGSFWRYRTPLHLITISDEPDQSTTHTYGSALRVIEEYEKKFDCRVTYTGVVSPFNSWGYSGLASVMQDDGQTVSIFDPDWVDVLVDYLDNLATEINYEYFLRDIPDEDTIEVLIEDDGITFVFSHEDWIYDPISNSIRFPYFNPESDAVIIVRYIPEQ